jgi:uncharacterized membrane protein YgcG
MRASFGSLLVVPWILFAQSSWNMDAVPVITALQPSSEATVEVRDHAELFDRGAEHRAREELERIHRLHRTPVHIETIKSLDGAWIADVAGQRARMVKSEQLYILVAGGERDVGIIAARRSPANRLTDQQREGIRRAFLGPLQAGKADEALERGVRAIGTTLDSAAASGPKLSARDALISVAILVVVVAALLTSRTRGWYEDRSRRHRRVAGAIARGHLGDPSSSSPEVSRALQATPTTGMRGPLRTAPSATRCREKVEA